MDSISILPLPANSPYPFTEEGYYFATAIKTSYPLSQESIDAMTKVAVNHGGNLHLVASDGVVWNGGLAKVLSEGLMQKLKAEFKLNGQPFYLLFSNHREALLEVVTWYVVQ